jgi:hypothetical protein
MIITRSKRAIKIYLPVWRATMSPKLVHYTVRWNDNGTRKRHSDISRRICQSNYIKKNKTKKRKTPAKWKEWIICIYIHTMTTMYIYIISYIYSTHHKYWLTPCQFWCFIWKIIHVALTGFNGGFKIKQEVEEPTFSATRAMGKQHRIEYTDERRGTWHAWKEEVNNGRELNPNRRS